MTRSIFKVVFNALRHCLSAYSLYSSLTCSTHLSTRSTRLLTRSTRLLIRLSASATRLSTRSICLSTRSTRLAIRLSTRSTGSTICRSFYN